MKLPQLHTRRARAFTLVELLVVLAIMAILIAVMTLGFRGLNSAGKFNKALNEISGILEQARAYAVAQDTYVWVVLYENDPANGPKDVYVAAFASNDGTDPFGWSASPATVVVPPGTVLGASTVMTPIIRIYHYQGLHLQTSNLPNAPGSPNLPAGASGSTPAPVFQCIAQSDSGPVTLSGTSAVYWVIQFTPTAAARNSSNPIDSIWLGLQPSLSQSLLDTHNIASLDVNGLTGVTTTYRP